MDVRPEGIILGLVTWQAGDGLPNDRRLALAAASWVASNQNVLLGAVPAFLAHQEADRLAAAPAIKEFSERDTSKDTKDGEELEKEVPSSR